MCSSDRCVTTYWDYVKRKEQRTSTIRGCVENETFRACVSITICKQKKGMISIHVHASLSAQ